MRKQTSAGRRTSPEGPSGANLAKCEPQPSEATRGGVSHLARFGAAGKRAAGKNEIFIFMVGPKGPIGMCDLCKKHSPVLLFC